MPMSMSMNTMTEYDYEYESMWPNQMSNQYKNKYMIMKGKNTMHTQK